MVRASSVDALADDLAGCFRGAGAPGPLESCVVAVQGPGLGRWLRVEMARRLGAWGGVDTPFLRAFLLDLASSGSGVAAPRGREAIEGLRFRVAAALSAAARGQGAVPARELEPVLRMVQDARGAIDHAGLLRVSHRVAEAFDRSEVDRPEVVLSWKQGRSAFDGRASAALRDLEAWQRPLWTATARDGESHAAWSRVRALVAQLERGSVPTGLRLPALVSVFGVSLLSPFMVQALRALGAHTQVVLHLLTPTQAFVAERSSRRQLLWEVAEAGLGQAEVERALRMEAGHPLLDAMGRQAAQAQRVLLDADAGLDADGFEPAVVSGDDTMLARLQRDLLEDRAAAQPPIAPDGSVQVHAVATPHRAAEVAHDAVLAAFAEMPGLRPERVAILTPDMEVTGNAIESVFAQRGQMALTASDARLSRPSSSCVALRHVLQAVVEGLTMACVQNALGQPSALAAMRLRADALGRWMDRLEQAGARRFLDAADRAARLERPQVEDDRLHTLQWAVDRVVLGMAVGCEADPLEPGEGERAWTAVQPDLLPASAPGSASLEELHQVVRAIEAIAQFVREAGRPRSLAAWCALTRQLADRLLVRVDHAEFGEERRDVELGLERLAQAATQGGFDEPVAFPVAREQLEAMLAEVRENGRFTGGGVTLARLSPTRSVPFDVLVLAGLDLGAFPRGRQADGLDLVSAAPRDGDQVPRQEDLQLFLECIHAARRRLVIIHQGVDPRTGARRPPSPVVDQLLDACVQGGANPDALRAQIVRVHPMRGDQPEAWTDAARAGFDDRSHRCAVATELGRRAPVTRPFVDVPQVPPRAPTTLHAWTKALREPAEAFLDRLGMRVPQTDSLLEESGELIVGDGLRDWARRESCMRAIFRGVDAETWERSLRLRGELPHGQHGHAQAQATLDDVRLAHAAVQAVATERDWRQGERVRSRPEHHAVEVRGMSYAVQVERLEGAPVQLLWFRASSKHHRLGLWMRHLLWSRIRPEGCSIEIPIGNKTVKIHEAVDPARALVRLERLMDFAIAATSVPMPLEPRAVSAWAAGTDETDRARRVHAALHGDRFVRGVLREPSAALVFGQESWGSGPSLVVAGASAPVPIGFDEIAAELATAMQEDGW